MFTPVSTVHDYPTRFRSKLNHSSDNNIGTFTDSLRYALPKVKGFGKKSFSYNGCCLWNDFPQSVREAKTVSGFKGQVKEHFLTIRN